MQTVLHRNVIRVHIRKYQHTATHCNTLQHTATHCNTLQHTATRNRSLDQNSTGKVDQAKVLEGLHLLKFNRVVAEDVVEVYTYIYTYMYIKA